MASELSNHFKYMLGTKKIDFTTPGSGGDTFKVRLMASGYTFSKDDHGIVADLPALSELATGYGYVQDTKTLGASTLTEDDTNDRLEVTWANVSWTASGGSIGPSPGAIIYDDTTTDDTIVGYIDFLGNQTATDGGTFTITNPTFRLA